MLKRIEHLKYIIFKNLRSINKDKEKKDAFFKTIIKIIKGRSSNRKRL